MKRVRGVCHFCWVFNREWKWKEPVIGYVMIYSSLNYPYSIDYPICWKCAILWREARKRYKGLDDMDWLHKYKTDDELVMEKLYESLKN